MVGILPMYHAGYTLPCIYASHTTLGIPTIPPPECYMSAVPLTGYTAGVRGSPGLKGGDSPGWEPPL